MTQKPELQGPGPQDAFTSAVVLGMAAYLVLPILAVVTAVMGLILVLNDRLVPGVIFVALITQVWIACGLWAHFRRRKVLHAATDQNTGEEDH